MTIHLLIQDAMLPVPNDITTVEDYGKISVVTDDGIIEGRHAVVDASEESLKNWLRPFDGVWVGEGPPQLQVFEVMHIRD